MRDLVAPPKGWRRGFKYIGKRVQRLPDTPHRIALGFACGAMASFTPFFTLHIFVAAFYGWIVRGNIISAAFGTIVGNPISFPLIATACMSTGNFLLMRAGGGDYSSKLTFEYAWNFPFDFFESIFTPYLVGGIIPGLLAAVASYFLLRPLVARFQQKRRDLLSSRARELVNRRQRPAPPQLELASSAPLVSGREHSGANDANGSSLREAQDPEIDPALAVNPTAAFPSATDWPERKVG
ncbi:MAG: DUF2062 domain-containing protein [Rhodobacteraceae bacterium]|nr:DUF2062 domain-containing protein [Paracoccaceae bacterium]